MEDVTLIHYGRDLELRGLYLDSLPRVDLEAARDVGLRPGGRYLVLYNEDGAKDSSKQPHRILEGLGVHFGPRKENFWDYSKCDYLTTRDGMYFKFVYKRYEQSITWLREDEYHGLEKTLDTVRRKLRGASLESGVSKKTGRPWYRLKFLKLKEVDQDVKDFCERKDYIKPPAGEVKYIKRVRSAEDIRASFGYFLAKPEGTVFGFDYETAYGMPMDSDGFRVMGLGIACCDGEAAAAYYDVQWMQDEGRDGEYDLFLEYLNRYLDRFERSVTYNNSFEQRVTYLLTGRLILFDEGATINKCDGLVHKRFSLKYTVQRALHIKSWDDDFERLTDELLPGVFERTADGGSYKWRLEADGEVTVDEEDGQGGVRSVQVPNGYESSPAWREILALFPEDREEFQALIRRNWGEPYACIPSRIMAEYCCRDAYYTGLLKVDCLARYSELCYSTYNNNLKLEALTHLTGMFQDEALRQRMILQCQWMAVYGMVNVLRWVFHEKLRWFDQLHIPEIPEITGLMRLGYNPLSSKEIILAHLSDTSESGLDRERLLPLLGEEVLGIYEEEVVRNCLRIDASFARARKVYRAIDARLQDRYRPEYGEGEDRYCQYTVGGKTYRIGASARMLRDYYVTDLQRAEIEHLAAQLPDFREINRLMIPGEGGDPELPGVLTTREGTELTLDGAVNYMSKGMYNIMSNDVTPLLKLMLYHRYKGVAYANALGERVPWGESGSVELTEKRKRALRRAKFQPYLLETKVDGVLGQAEAAVRATPGYEYFELNHDSLSLAWSAIASGKALLTVRSFRKGPGGKPLYVMSDLTEGWFNDAKLELRERTLNDVSKYTGIRCLEEGDLDRLIREFHSVDVTGDGVESLAKFGYCYLMVKKYSKILGTYLRGHFGSYLRNAEGFDGNGVTVHRNAGKGVYKTYMPFNANEKKSKRWASPYHTIPSQSEIKRIITTPPGYLMSYFDISGAEVRTISYMSRDPFMMSCYDKGLDPYITMAKYSFPDRADDEAYIRGWRSTFKTVLLGLMYGMGTETLAEKTGMTIEHAEQVIEDLWKRCPVLKEFINAKSAWAEAYPGFVQSAMGDVLELNESDGADRAARLGINQFIQNYASVSLADGFYNNIEKSIHGTDPVLNDPSFIVRVLGVVHDSCQNYFPTKYLFEMNDYYVRNMTDYLFKLHKIYYTFDLDIGANYYDMVHTKQLAPNRMELKANRTSLGKLLDKCSAEGLPFRITEFQNLKTKEAVGFEGQRPDPAGFQREYYDSVLREMHDAKDYDARFDLDNSSYRAVIERVD